MEFTQTDSGVEMTCTTSTSSDETRKRFCDVASGKKPKAYIIQGLTDCSALPTSGTIQAQAIATLENPSENTIFVFIFGEGSQ